MDPGRHSHFHFLNDTDERKQQKGALILVAKGIRYHDKWDLTWYNGKFYPLRVSHYCKQLKIKTSFAMMLIYIRFIYMYSLYKMLEKRLLV